MKNYIFVSYSHRDKQLIRSLIDRLERKGLSIWYDKDIEPGTLWDDVIKGSLKDAAVVLMFISSSFIKSEYCRLELRLSLEQKKHIIPVYLENARFEPALQEQIDRIQQTTVSPVSEDEFVQSLIKMPAVEKCQARYRSSGSGPDRELFSKDASIDHVTFNSVKDHPLYGNEKKFLRVKLPGETEFHPYVSVKIRPGKVYEFELLLHNNADPSLNPKGTGLAMDTRIAVHMPDYVRPSRPDEIMAVLSSSNAAPAQIWDSVEFHSEKTLFLKYVDASGFCHNRGKCDGQMISSLYLLSDHGFYIGVNKFNGYLPGGDDYISRITFKMLAFEESSEIGYSKEIVKENDLPADHVRIGEVFTVRTEFHHLGTIDFRNVCFRETFPDGLELIPGTTVLRNNANPDGVLMKDLIHKNGFNTGTYGPHSNAVITYQAKFTSGSGKMKIGGQIAHDSGQYNYYKPVIVET